MMCKQCVFVAAYTVPCYVSVMVWYLWLHVQSLVRLVCWSGICGCIYSLLLC